MNRIAGLLTVLFLCRCLAGQGWSAPNIVFILADDLGYGDVQSLNPERGRIPTPHIDQLAREGMSFTDAHSSSSVCTPTRYSILTGRYNWRTRLQWNVLYGYSKPLIPQERLTVAGMLRSAGYATACIGKWHLGMEIPEGEADPEIREGPVDRGFDYFFGISGSLDMPPFAYIENRRYTEPLTTEKKWIRRGPAAAGFEAVEVLPTLVERAVAYIEGRRGQDQPFFLYLPLTSPHTPILPTAEWKGRSGLGKYGDFVMETDWAVGEVVAALARAGLAEDTLVIFTSDNGCSKSARIGELEEKGHFPSGPFRGSKSDIWEGGHRIPFIVRWPGRVAAGSRSDALVCQMDFMATCAEILGLDLPPDAAEDSVSFLPVLLGREGARGRSSLVHHSFFGVFAIRSGPWKLALCPGSGGWTAPAFGSPEAAELPPVQLYDMRRDPGETTNLQAEFPQVVHQLEAELTRIVESGRSTPGPELKNDVDVVLRKSPETLEKKK